MPHFGFVAFGRTSEVDFLFTKPGLVSVRFGLVMFLSSMNFDTKAVVAILGQDSAFLCCGLSFRFPTLWLLPTLFDP